MKVSSDLLEMLRKLAGDSADCDDSDFNAMEWSGGNYDDAYSIGRDDGEILLARHILASLEAK